VARAVRLLPALRDLAEKSWTKALTLIEGTDPVMLADIAMGDTALTLDEIDRLTVVDLKKRLRTLTEDVAGEVKRQTKVMTVERDALIDKVAELEQLVDPSWEGMGRAVKRLREAQATLADECRALMLILEHLPGDDPAARLTLEQSISGAARLFADLWTQYQDRAANDWPDQQPAD